MQDSCTFDAILSNVGIGIGCTKHFIMIETIG